MHVGCSFKYVTNIFTVLIPCFFIYLLLFFIQKCHLMITISIAKVKIFYKDYLFFWKNYWNQKKSTPFFFSKNAIYYCWGLRNIETFSWTYFLRAKKSEGLPESGPSFSFSHKSYKREKYVSELDGIDCDVVRRTLHVFYDRREYHTSHLILDFAKNKINYSGSLTSIQRLFKIFKFSCKKFSDGRKFLMERNDIDSLRYTFLDKFVQCTKIKIID